MKLERVARNPILAENSQDEGLGHYRCQLLSPGKRLAVYLSIRAEDQLLTLSDVLFLLALDATGCGMMGGFDTYRDKWNGMFGGMGCKPQEIEFFGKNLRVGAVRLKPCRNSSENLLTKNCSRCLAWKKTARQQRLDTLASGWPESRLASSANDVQEQQEKTVVECRSALTLRSDAAIHDGRLLSI